MPIEVGQPGQPPWWLARLLKKLGAQRQHAEFLDRYYTNEAEIPLGADKATKDAYRRLRAMSRTNFAELVVEAVRERMNPVGFHTGAEGDELGDAEAWRIWQANQLDADSALVHRSMLSTSLAYVIVGPVDREINAPVITPETPCEVVTEQDPIRKRKTIAALKAFRDDVRGVDRAYLYLPGAVFQATRPVTTESEPFSDDLAGWEWSGGQALPVPGVVPVVRFVNRATMSGWGKGEFEPHLPILDRINYQILNRLEIATLQAFRQRAIKGKLPTHDAEGNEIDYDDVFAAAPGALWQLGDAAEIWESGIVDLTPIRTAVRDDVQDLAAVTRTPLFYLTPDAANGSAEGASLAREGLVFKTTDRLVQTGESWEQVMSLAFMFAGDEVRASRAGMEIMWASPERFSLAERYDAAAKAQAAGVTWRATMEDVLQFSPQKIQRMESERADDLLRAAQLAATVQPQTQAAASGANA